MKSAPTVNAHRDCWRYGCADARRGGCSSRVCVVAGWEAADRVAASGRPLPRPSRNATKSDTVTEVLRNAGDADTRGRAA